MFRTKEGGLQADPTYPTNLKELGFFVNNVGQIRMTEFPDKDYQYQYSNSERHNEVRREAMQGKLLHLSKSITSTNLDSVCQRNEVEKRLTALGLEKLYVPQLTTVRPEGEASTAILAPPPDVLRKRKRVIVLVNSSLQDLGILTYRRLQRDLGLNAGSVVNFAKEIFTRSTTGEHEGVKRAEGSDIFKDGAHIPDKKQAPGLIVMNCGQLLFSYKLGKALTTRSWLALPRKSVFHPPVEISPENHIQGSYDAKEHIKFVIKNVINNSNFVSKQAEVYYIGIENGAENLIEILRQDFDTYGSRITAMAFINPLLTRSYITNPTLEAFLHRRARQWKVTSESTDPQECIEAPLCYAQESSKSLDTPNGDQISAKSTKWLELVSPLSADSDMGKQQEFLMKGIYEYDGMEPICPTFAGGPDNINNTGECIFTDPAVQHCILEFFEEVAHNPNNYFNPGFKAARSAPLEWGEEGDAAYQPLQPAQISPERAELEKRQRQLADMREAFENVSRNDETMHKGIQALHERILKETEDLESFEQKVLGIGALKAGEAQELRENWNPEKQGPFISFAGVKVDSELVKGAGLEETAEEELAKLGVEQSE